MGMSFQEGLYDSLLTEADAELLSALPPLLHPQIQESSSPLEVAQGAADALHKVLSRLLEDLDGNDSQKILGQIAVVNALLAEFRKRTKASELGASPLQSPPVLLKGVFRGTQPLLPPDTGLRAPWLFTAGKGSPSLLSEIRRELASCDAVDILVSFITLSGLRKLEDLLTSITAHGADGVPRTRIRVLTTTYTGATDAAALDRLASLPGCEVRISLDGRRTRLHAKAWMFHRKTGFGSAYVGSANLSAAALLGGLEWTVKFTQQGQVELYSRALAHFETLWNDSEFSPYDPTILEHREELCRALNRESGDRFIASPGFFDITPKEYQRGMLDALATERAHGRMRSLVVAATGTGKTVVAAFDYRAICTKEGGRPRLLFVAHREEILRQALRTYREVLRDHSFGELLAGGREPASHDHLFATIDSVTSRDLLSHWGVDYWSVVVVDECHRLAADRFDSFVTRIRPHYLVGLTATPERADAKPILSYFDARPDGAPAIELRLWHALDLQLLTPFEYYGCDDDTDFSDVPWSQPGEIAKLSDIVTGNDVRARLVVNEWTRLAGDPRKSKALAFCVNVAHARFMTNAFLKAGIPALCVVGETELEERRSAPERLRKGEVSVLVTCDLYNEGVDLPTVDTLLLLRPTQSPVLFQQQIGRGLRLAEGKESCLVLDFVGRFREGFRFDRLFGSITGLVKRELQHAVENGFSTLPPGCYIHLQSQTREQVLRSLRAAINQNWRRLKAELISYSALIGNVNVSMSSFVREQGVELTDMYRSREPSGWTALMRDAQLETSVPHAEDGYFGSRFRSLLHLDDPLHLEFISHVAKMKMLPQGQGAEARLRLLMLAYQIDGRNSQIGTASSFLERLHSSPSLTSELGELAAILLSRSTLQFVPVADLEDTPLCLHASYEIREILTAVGYYTEERRTPFQAGVLALPKRKQELLFVTLDKSEGFHAATSYHDYAISRELFHWQSQNSARPDKGAGKRYVDSRANGWKFSLFVRQRKGLPYQACGPVTISSWQGSQPISITWQLQTQLPSKLFQAYSVIRGA